MPPDEPIRILRVIARLNVGGPALHVSHLSRELDRIGYETTLVAGRVDESEGSMEYVARELGVVPEYVPQLQREISPLADSVAIAGILRLIRRHRPHILHTHTAKAGAVGRIAALLAGPGRPQVVVHTFHGHVLRGYFSPAKTAGFRQLERQLARISDALIAVSPEIRDDLVALGVAPAEKISVVRLGLPLETRAAAGEEARGRIRAELGIEPGRFTVGWLGRMTEIKHCDDLLRSFAGLRARGVEADLVLAGDGPLRGSLESLARELGIAADCRFVGYREDVGDLYAAIDAFALTSGNEGTPVAAIEALAAHRPVVSTDVGGVRDVVLDGRSGYLVGPGDVPAITDALQRLAADPALRTAFGKEGHEYVLRRYSIPRLVSDLDGLYRSLLEREPAAARRKRPRPAALTPAIPPDRLPDPAPRTLRILILSQYFPPEVGATQSRMQSFAEYLAARGHEVTVVSEFPNHPQGVIPPEYRGRLIEDDRSNPYRVLRVWVKANEEKTQATRMAFYLSYMALATAVAPLVGKVDVVLATSPPLFTGVAGLAISRLKRAAFVLDVRDLWPAAAISLLQISGGRELRAAEALERTLYRGAAAVVAVTEPFCAHVDAIRRKPPATALVPNGTLELFFDENGGVDRLAPPDRFLVTFAGTLGIAQALPSVLDAAERLDDGYRFAFVGDGPLRETLVADAAARGLANVSFHEQRPLEQIPPILQGSDALLVTLSSHPTFADFVPSKMIDCMAAGRPVILSAAGESARLLEQAGAGVVVAPEDPEALAEALRWLREHPDEGHAMGERGRSFARGRLRSVQAARLEQVLLEAAGSR